MPAENFAQLSRGLTEPRVRYIRKTFLQGEDSVCLTTDPSVSRHQSIRNARPGIPGRIQTTGQSFA